MTAPVPPDANGLREAVEALAEQYERDAKAESYGGELWSTTANALRALLAASEAAPTAGEGEE